MTLLEKSLVANKNLLQSWLCDTKNFTNSICRTLLLKELTTRYSWSHQHQKLILRF